MGLEPEGLQFGMIVRAEGVTLQDPVELLKLAPMKGDDRLGLEDALVPMQPGACRQGPEKSAEPLHGACLLENLADTRDLLLREAETRQLAVTAAPGGARRAVLRTVAGRPGRPGCISVLHRAARRRVSGQGRGRALGAVVAGGGTENVRATGAASTRRRAHRTPVTSGATVGHHGCVIAGVHHDPPHRGTAALHRAADRTIVLYSLGVRDRTRDVDDPTVPVARRGASLPLTRRSSSRVRRSPSAESLRIFGTSERGHRAMRLDLGSGET